jgi:hypothetical protein
VELEESGDLGLAAIAVCGDLTLRHAGRLRTAHGGDEASASPLHLGVGFARLALKLYGIHEVMIANAFGFVSWTRRHRCRRS